MTLRMRETMIRVIWILLLFVFAAASSSPVFISICGVRPQLVLAAGISAVILESNVFFACAYAVLSGLLIDTISGQLFGFYGFMMLICSAAAAFLMENYLRANVWNAGWMSAAVSLVTGFVSAELTVIIWNYANGQIWNVILRLIVRAVFTGAVAPAVGVLMRWIKRLILGGEEKKLRMKSTVDLSNKTTVNSDQNKGGQ